MTDDDLEKRLRAALRPVEPPPGFANRVMARIEGGEQSASCRRSARDTSALIRRERVLSWAFWRPVRWRSVGVRPARWLPVALAASLILTVVVIHEHRKREQGLQARQQLIEALRVTGEKLDLAYRAVNAS